MTTSTISHAPQYNLHRDGVTTPDGAASTLTTKAHGVNASGYLSALIQVVPTGGANPSVQVLSWCEEAASFIQQSPDVAVTGAGVNTPYEFTFPCKSRIFLVRVSAIAAGSCKVFVSGHELDHAR